MEQTITMTGDDRLTDQQLIQAEIDLRRDFASGYANNARAPVQLQKLFNELSAEQTTKRDQEENLERFVRESRAKTDKAQEDAQESIRTMSMEEWLESKHRFGNIEMTGAEWRHLAAYTKENKERMIEEWMQKDYSRAEVEKALKVIDVMAKPNKTPEEEEFIKTAKQDQKTDYIINGMAEQSGLENVQKPDPQSSVTTSKVEFTPANFTAPTL